MQFVKCNQWGLKALSYKVQSRERTPCWWTINEVPEHWTVLSTTIQAHLEGWGLPLRQRGNQYYNKAGVPGRPSNGKARSEALIQCLESGYSSASKT